jgi:hypothetical protein
VYARKVKAKAKKAHSPEIQQEIRVVFSLDSWHAVNNKSAEVVSFALAGRLLSPAKAGWRKLRRARKRHHFLDRALRAAVINKS